MNDNIDSINNKIFGLNNFNNIISDNSKSFDEFIFGGNSSPSFLNDRLLEVTKEEYQSIFSNDISGNDKLEIFHKIISNIVLNDSYSKEQASNIYRFLLNRDGSYDDAEIEFISYYTVYLNYYRIKYDETGNVKPGFENVMFPKVEFVTLEEKPELGSEKTLAAYSFSGNVIYVNKDSNVLSFKDGDKDKLFSYLQCLCHEMVHCKQSFEAKNGVLSVSSFNNIVSTIIRLQEFDNGTQNYRFRREEVEAQVESMQYAIELSREFFPQYVEFQEEMASKREDYLLEEVLAMQHDDTDFLALRDFYDIGGLSVAIAKKPNYLKRYPQLLSFFDEKGNMRSEEELLQGYQVCKKADDSIASIYEEFLVYIYHKDRVVKNTDLSPELISIKKLFIFEQVNSELKKLAYIKRIVDDHKTKIGSKRVWEKFHTEGIVERRMKRLESYYDFLSSVDMNQNSNNDVLDELEIMINAYGNIISDINKQIEFNNMIDNEINIDKYGDIDNNKNK